MEIGAIEPLWYVERIFEAELTEELPIFNKKWHIVWSNFQDGFRAMLLTVSIAEARIKEASIVRT
jgi:hypothetical protein